MKVFKEGRHRAAYAFYHGIAVKDFPKDSQGRSFEVHHVDGNRANNTKDNLILVSIAEHYAIHEFQQDWGACARMAHRMGLSPKDTSRLCSLAQLKRFSNPAEREKASLGMKGRKANENQRKALNRTGKKSSAEHRAKISIANTGKKRSEEQLEAMRQRKLGTKASEATKLKMSLARKGKPIIWNLQNQTPEANAKRSATMKAVKWETHTCPHCQTVGKSNAMKRWHFDNCKET
jgi:hypothetical protein